MKTGENTKKEGKTMEKEIKSIAWIYDMVTVTLTFVILLGSQLI